jgi:hypothetical protein
LQQSIIIKSSEGVECNGADVTNDHWHCAENAVMSQGELRRAK